MTRRRTFIYTFGDFLGRIALSQLSLSSTTTTEKQREARTGKMMRGNQIPTEVCNE